LETGSKCGQLNGTERAGARTPVENVERVAGSRCEATDERDIERAAERGGAGDRERVVLSAFGRAGELDLKAAGGVDLDVAAEGDGSGAVAGFQVAVQLDIT